MALCLVHFNAGPVQGSDNGGVVLRDGLGQPEHHQHVAIDDRGRTGVADDAGQGPERKCDHRDELLRRGDADK